MLVNEQRQVVHLSETAGRFVQPSGGPLTRDATELVRPELRVELRGALFRAFDRAESSLSSFMSVGVNGNARRVALLVRPHVRDGRERLALVMFIEGDVVVPHALPTGDDAGAGVVRYLEDELRVTQGRLATTREEFEAGTEELRAANEELQSINEEYRSTAEELETSKEELQSINEELETVNAELKVKLTEIARAHGDLENLMAATEIGTLFLDRALRISRFTPPVATLFNITDGDRGRSITDFTHHLDYTGLPTDAKQVLRTLATIEREVRDVHDGWYLMRLRPYRTLDDRIDGVIVTFVEFTARRTAEEALRVSEERYRLLVEGVEEYAMLATDLDGRITTWNAGAKRLFGYGESEIIGQPLDTLFTDEDRSIEIPAQELATALARGVVTDDRWQARKDGTRFWASGTLTPLRESDGRVRGFAKILRDNTERRAAEAVQVHFQSLFESAPGLYLVLRPDNYVIVAVSDAYLGATMTRREEIVGRRVFGVLPYDFADPNANGIRDLEASLDRVKRMGLADVMAVQRFAYRRPGDGDDVADERWWSAVNSPVNSPGGELAYIIHRVEDVTPFLREMRDQGREAEGHRLLESRAQHMEAEIAVRARELLRANEQLRQLNEALEAQAVERERLLLETQEARAEAEHQGREALTARDAKTQFITMMSHELRTPLNAIAGYVQLLELGIHGPVTEAQRAALGRVQRAERHLLVLINDVLNVNRLGSSGLTYDIRATDAGAVMTDVGVLIEPQLKAKGLIYEVRRPADAVLVWADADRLRQVLTNLIANAIRFTPSGGRIMTEISVRAAMPDVVYLRVHDTGIGIERHKQEMIFDPFVTLSRTFAEGTDGSGLGLTISRELARGMGGDLRVRSAEGKGSTFTVTLRRATNGAVVDAPIEDDEENGARNDLPDHYS
jgi:two-component system CheB/CheR fusion protein